MTESGKRDAAVVEAANKIYNAQCDRGRNYDNALDYEQIRQIIAEVERAAFEAGRGQERKRFDDAGVYFCGCGHTNMEHCADAGWMSDPDVKYPCTLCACQDCALPAPPDSGDRHTCQPLSPNSSVPYGDGPCMECAKEKGLATGLNDGPPNSICMCGRGVKCPIHRADSGDKKEAERGC